MSTNNINIIREVFDEIFAKGNIGSYSKFVDNNIQAHCPPSWKEIHFNEIDGISNVKEIDEAYIKAFKMDKVEMHDIIASGDKVVVRWSCNGKHSGNFFGIEPTHKRFELTGISIYRLHHEKIVEVWQSWDMFGLLQQLKHQ